MPRTSLTFKGRFPGRLQSSGSMRNNPVPRSPLHAAAPKESALGRASSCPSDSRILSQYNLADRPNPLYTKV